MTVFPVFGDGIGEMSPIHIEPQSETVPVES